MKQEYQTVIEYLSSFQRKRRRITGQKEELEEFKLTHPYLTSVRYDVVRKGKRWKPTGCDDLIIQIADRELKFMTAALEYFEFYNQLLGQLEKLDDGIHEEILCRHYIDGMSLKEVATAMGYEYKWLAKKHKEAVEEFARVNGMVSD